MLFLAVLILLVLVSSTIYYAIETGAYSYTGSRGNALTTLYYAHALYYGIPEIYMNKSISIEGEVFGYLELTVVNYNSTHLKLLLRYRIFKYISWDNYSKAYMNNLLNHTFVYYFPKDNPLPNPSESIVLANLPTPYYVDPQVLSSNLPIITHNYTLVIPYKYIIKDEQGNIVRNISFTRTYSEYRVLEYSRKIGILKNYFFDFNVYTNSTLILKYTYTLSAIKSRPESAVVGATRTISYAIFSLTALSVSSMLLSNIYSRREAELAGDNG